MGVLRNGCESSAVECFERAGVLSSGMGLSRSGGVEFGRSKSGGEGENFLEWWYARVRGREAGVKLGDVLSMSETLDLVSGDCREGFLEVMPSSDVGSVLLGLPMSLGKSLVSSSSIVAESLSLSHSSNWLLICSLLSSGLFRHV